jgi:hypothetical protein
MRINEILIEQQLDELSLAGVGRGVGKVAGGIGKAIGGTVGGAVSAVKQFGKGLKTGYTSARDTVAGTTTATPATAPAASGGATAPAASGGATAPAASGGATAPAASGGATAPAASGPKVTVGQINKVIPTLRTRDLESVKRTVDTAINNKKGSAPSEPAAEPATTPPNLKVTPGGKKAKKTAPASGADIAVTESKFYSKFLNCEI